MISKETVAKIDKLIMAEIPDAKSYRACLYADYDGTLNMNIETNIQVSEEEK